jgi:hypothetical protein
MCRAQLVVRWTCSCLVLVQGCHPDTPPEHMCRGGQRLNTTWHHLDTPSCTPSCVATQVPLPDALKMCLVKNVNCRRRRNSRRSSGRRSSCGEVAVQQGGSAPLPVPLGPDHLPLQGMAMDRCASQTVGVQVQRVRLLVCRSSQSDCWGAGPASQPLCRWAGQIAYVHTAARVHTVRMHKH